MWIRTTSELSENTVQLVTDTATHAVIRDDVLALVDTGISANAAQLIELVEKLIEDPRELHYVLLTHDHFDHVGGVPALRAFNPELELIASPQVAEKLGDKEFLLQLYKKNAACSEAFGQKLEVSEDEWCSAFSVQHIVRDGDALQLGDEVEIKVIGLPGHTEHSLAFFVRPDGVIIGDEALGAYYGRQKTYPAADYSVVEYKKSLERIGSLDVAVVCLPHTGAITGVLVQQYLGELRVRLDQFEAQVKERLAAGEIVDEVVQSILLEWKEADACPEGPFLEEQKSTVHNMVQAIAANR